MRRPPTASRSSERRRSPGSSRFAASPSRSLLPTERQTRPPPPPLNGDGTPVHRSATRLNITDEELRKALTGVGNVPLRCFDVRALSCLDHRTASPEQVQNGLGIAPAGRLRARNQAREAWSSGDREKLRQIDLHLHDLRHEGACRLLAGWRRQSDHPADARQPMDDADRFENGWISYVLPER